MSNIPRISLEDTFTLIQLVRETALAQGRETQANKLAPIMDEMKELVTTARKSQPASAPLPEGILGQPDFKKLLEVSSAVVKTPNAQSVSSAMERNRLIQAMAGTDMSEVDIARQFGMTREEVRLVLKLQQNSML